VPTWSASFRAITHTHTRTHILTHTNGPRVYGIKHSSQPPGRDHWLLRGPQANEANAREQREEREEKNTRYETVDCKGYAPRSAACLECCSQRATIACLPRLECCGKLELPCPPVPPRQSSLGGAQLNFAAVILTDARDPRRNRRHEAAIYLPGMAVHVMGPPFGREREGGGEGVPCFTAIPGAWATLQRRASFQQFHHISD